MLKHALYRDLDMTAPLKAIDGNADLTELMTALAARARDAARVLSLAPAEQKNRALEAIERAMRAHSAAILAANAEDVAEVRANGATSAFIDRLTLTPNRIDAMADGGATVRAIVDPVGSVTERTVATPWAIASMRLGVSVRRSMN